MLTPIDSVMVLLEDTEKKRGLEEPAHVFFCKHKINKNVKIQLFRHPFNTTALGTPLGARAPNSMQDSLNESSVRPNGTPVMQLLRSKKTQKFLKICLLLRFSPFFESLEFTWRIKGKSQLVPFICDYILDPT